MRELRRGNTGVLAKGVRARRVRAGALLGLVAAVVLLECTQAPKVPATPRCPEMTVDAIEHYDFAIDMAIPPPLSTKLRGGVQTALLLDNLAQVVDTSLRDVCLGYLGDLGVKVQAKTSTEACQSLVQTISGLRARLGPSVVIETDLEPSVCTASLDLANVCASQCDPAVAAASLSASCEPGTLQGSCDGSCSGSCDEASPARCGGACIGSCDARVKGLCSGVCVGRCDGRVTPKKGAPCLGVCEGVCDGQVEASCMGNCTGTCALAAADTCKGTCTGSCSSGMKSAACTGDLVTPKMIEDCKAKCDAIVACRRACTNARAFVRVAGALDPTMAQTFRLAAEKNLPIFSRLIAGIGERTLPLLPAIGANTESIRTLVTAALTNPISPLGMHACFDKPFADVPQAAASLRGNLELAISVKATLASGGPTAGAVVVAPRR